MKPLHSSVQPYSAVVLGSTGNVGRQIVSLLVASSEVSKVVVVNRRQTDEFKGMPKVREVVVPDMDKLADAVAPEAREARTDSSASNARTRAGTSYFAISSRSD